MRWGYGHKFGPFELWDALGFEDVARRLEDDGRVLPKNIRQMRRRGELALSHAEGDGIAKQYFDFATKDYRESRRAPASWCSPT